MRTVRVDVDVGDSTTRQEAASSPQAHQIDPRWWSSSGLAAGGEAKDQDSPTSRALMIRITAASLGESLLRPATCRRAIAVESTGLSLSYAVATTGPLAWRGPVGPSRTSPAGMRQMAELCRGRRNRTSGIDLPQPLGRSRGHGKIQGVTTYATLHTNKGDIKVELFDDLAPQTVKNFVGLAEGTQEWTDPATRHKRNDPLYDGVIFHRVIPGFMIQGGDPLGRGTGGPGYQFADEFTPDKTFDKPYLLAMANSGPNTNGSQFFITVAPTAWLNFKHSIFGEVADQEGRDVVDAIAAVSTDRQDRPKDEVRIESITVEREES